MNDSVNPETGTEPANPEGEAGLFDPLEKVSALLELESEPTSNDEITPEKANQESDEDAEPDGEDPDKKGSEPADDDDSEEVAIPDTVKGLAEALKVEPEDLANHIRVPVTVDGTEQLVSLADAAKGYQLESDYRQKTAALAEEKRGIAAQVEAGQREIAEKSQRLDTLLQALNAQVEAGPSDAELNQILATEGAEAYLAAKAQVDGRRNALVQAFQARQQEEQRARAEFEQHVHRYRQEQQQILLQKEPGFSSNADALQKDITDALSEHGFSNDEITGFFNGPYDHRHVLLALDAARYRALQAGKKSVVKTAKAKPKIVKSSGTAKAKAKPGDSSDLRARLRKAGRSGNKRQQDDAAFDLVKSLLD